MARMATLRLLLLALSGYWFTAVRAQEVCTAPTGDPTHCICDTPDGTIDITGIADSSKQPEYTSLIDSSGNSYDFNPCYGFTESTCTNAVACQLAGDGVEYSCGDISTGEFHYDPDTKKAYILYSGGDDQRGTQVNLNCDESVTEEATVTADGDSVFEVAHQCACPGACGGGGGIEVGIVGLVLIILTITGFVGYFVVGAVIMSVKFQKKGTDIIPQKDFWIGFPILLKDGTMFVISPIIGLIRKGGKGEYEQLS